MPVEIELLVIEPNLPLGGRLVPIALLLATKTQPYYIRTSGRAFNASAPCDEEISPPNKKIRTLTVNYERNFRTTTSILRQTLLRPFKIIFPKYFCLNYPREKAIFQTGCLMVGGWWMVDGPGLDGLYAICMIESCVCLPCIVCLALLGCASKAGCWLVGPVFVVAPTR